VRLKAKERAENEKAAEAVVTELDEAADVHAMRTANKTAESLSRYFLDEHPWNELLSNAIVKARPRLMEMEAQEAAARRAARWRSVMSYVKCLPVKCLPGSV